MEEFNSDEISYEISYEIRYYVIKHRRKKYQKTCNCPGPIVRAQAPVKLFDKGLYSTEFWIKVLIDKYAHGIPLTRQIEIMPMEQLSIAKSSLCNGLWKISEYLQPLHELMLEKIAFEPLIHADETRWL